MRKSVSHRLVWVVLLVVVAVALSACIDGSDDADPTATSEPLAIATTVASPIVQATSTATVVATQPAPTSTSVPPTTRTPTPQPTATVTPVPKVALGAINPLDPFVLTNFTLNAGIEVRGVPNQSDVAMTLLVIQAAPDRYYLKSTSGSAGIESWLVDGTTYLTQADGSVAQLPGDSDTALFSPALLVQTVPTVSGDTVGIQLGTEDIGGRQATKYQIDGEDLLPTAAWLPGDGTSAVEGQVDVWIDSELGIILRQESNVGWTNSDGSTGSFSGVYEVLNISTTEPVTAPE